MLEAFVKLYLWRSFLDFRSIRKGKIWMRFLGVRSICKGKNLVVVPRC
jgi:hypothetical protein